MLFLLPKTARFIRIYSLQRGNFKYDFRFDSSTVGTDLVQHKSGELVVSSKHKLVNLSLKRCLIARWCISGELELFSLT